MNPTSAKSSIHLLILHFNHSPVMFSEREGITIGIDFFKETIIKNRILLNKFPSSSCPTKSPLCYCTDFCQYISSMIKTQSLDTVCFPRSILAIFREWVSPDVNFFNTLNEGSSSSFRRSLHVWYELYQRSK